ncbi:MAG TPA: FAD-dependent oxidoreductase [Chthoniobacteraceae bacterium]|nr:FAD-dependent oxidoreductase [Chthoniobacteraceae bacterium]
MKQVIVVGGGIIGLSSAYYLKQAGFEVTVLDPDGGRVGASYGNAGFIGSSHYIPLSNPYAFSNAMRWMLSPTSPFYIQPRLSLKLIRWGLLFMRHANATHVDRMAKPLADIGLLSQRLFEEWEKTFGGFSYDKLGLLNLYQTEKGLQSAIEESKRARSLGLDAVEVTPAEIRELEPDVEIKAIGGVFMRSDASTYPPRLMATLLKVVKEQGVRIIEERATDFEIQKGHIVAVKCGDQRHEADHFVLASGVWAEDLAHSIGLSIPMHAGRGYSITYPIEQLPLHHPLYLGEVSVALTPMDGDKVRVGGTMEIVPVGTPPRINRVKGFLSSATRFIPNANFPEPTFKEAWFGYRPCSADGVPYIGRTRSFDNLVIATGHSMLGFGLGPATGKLVCELVQNEPTSMDVTPFSPDRFR